MFLVSGSCYGGSLETGALLLLSSESQEARSLTCACLSKLNTVWHCCGLRILWHSYSQAVEEPCFFFVIRSQIAHQRWWELGVRPWGLRLQVPGKLVTHDYGVLSISCGLPWLSFWVTWLSR